MHTETVYIFPNITPTTEVVFPLAQIFEQVVFLRPVENDPSIEEELAPLLREMLEQKRIDFVSPVPLLGDHDRFLQLIHEVQCRPDDYARQLSNLAIAGLGGWEETETEASIMNTLLRQTGIQAGGTGGNTSEDEKEQEEQKDKQRFMLLWQARLVLKLGEIIDRKQEEIQKSLNRIVLRENELLQDLREDGELLPPHTVVCSNDISGSQQRLRLKAWSRLFAFSQQPLRSPLFITWSRDAFEPLVEQYSREYSAKPRHLLTLPLPAVMTGGNCTEQRGRFQEDAAALISSIRESLDNQAMCEAGEKNAWGDVLELHYPTAENGRCRLSLYSLPEIVPQEFFLDTFVSGKEKSLLEQTGDRREGVIIGIIEIMEELPSFDD